MWMLLTLEPLRSISDLCTWLSAHKTTLFSLDKDREGERGGGPMRQSSEMVGGNIFDIGTNSP